MYSVSATDDEDLFIPTISSNLAALFNNPNAQLVPSQCHDLSYSAPRQPKLLTNSNDNNSAPTTPTVLCAKAVQVYKLIDKQYAPQGKYGFAISGVAAIKTYEIIIYKDKQNVLHRTKIYPEFRFILQPNNFASFFDENKQNWSIYFETQKDLNDMIHQLEVISVKVIPIEEKSLPDIKKDLELKPTQLPVTEIISENNAASTEIENNSEQTNSIQSTRENILSRMAKMGQPTLMPKPLLKPKTPSDDISDSETDSSDNIKRKPRKLLPTKPSLEKSIRNVQPETFVLVNGQYIPVQKTAYETSKNSALVTYEPPVQPQNYISDPMQILLSENRTLNSEMRMHLFRLANKLEDSQNVKSNETKLDESSIKSLETKLDKITKLLNDTKNESSSGDFHDLEIASYKHRIKELEQLVENQNKKIKDLEQKESSSLDEIKELLSKQTEAINVLKSSNESKPQDIKKYKENVKKIMNTVYKELNDTFENIPVYQSDIKTVLANKIVDTTYKIIENFESNLENQSMHEECM